VTTEQRIVDAVTAGAGFLWEHAEATFYVLVGVVVLIVLARVGYNVALAWADLRLRHRLGDATGAATDWLSPGAREKGGPGGRHSAVYQWYMQSPQWAARRERTLMLAGGTCQKCGRERATDAHHKHYRTLGFERDGDLLAVCGACHRRLHSR
jgi:hypothetical protein